MIWSRKFFLDLALNEFYRRNGHMFEREGGEVKYFLFRTEVKIRSPRNLYFCERE